MTKKICWVITDGKAGCISQALGLAEAINLDLKIEQKILKKKFPFSLIPPLIWVGAAKFLTKDSDKMSPPWPDILISCGTQTIPFMLFLKKMLGHKVFSVYVQDPKIYARDFDLVIAMEHDKIEGDNVLKSNMALHRVTKAKLAEEKENFSELFLKLKPPFYSVLIGGATKRCKMSAATCADLLDKIKSIKKQLKGTLLISPSRRTPNEFIDLLKQTFSNDNAVYIVDPHNSKNPYYAMLAVSEKIFVTNDSVSMISEACAAQKQVYILPLLNFNSGKPRLFAYNLISKNLASLFDGGVIRNSTISITNETKEIAEKVKKIYCNSLRCIR